MFYSTPVSLLSAAPTCAATRARFAPLLILEISGSTADMKGWRSMIATSLAQR